MTNRLTALTKRVAELHQASLVVCHYIKEFYHRWIRPLGRCKKLVFECPQMADPYREPSKGCPFVFSSALLTTTLFKSDISFYMMQLHHPKN
jgi:hypothetical protein